MENKDVIDILGSVDTKLQNLSSSMAGEFKEIRKDIDHLKQKIDTSIADTNMMKITHNNCMKSLAENRVKWDEAYKDTTILRMARKNPKVIAIAFAVVIYMGGPEWLAKIGQLISSINF